MQVFYKRVPGVGLNSAAAGELIDTLSQALSEIVIRHRLDIDADHLELVWQPLVEVEIVDRRDELPPGEITCPAEYHENRWAGSNGNISHRSQC